MYESIYLDHNATTPISPVVLQAMQQCWAEHAANPASQHHAGRASRRIVENARRSIAELLGASTGSIDSDLVIFTSGGTESNNLAIRGLSSRIGQPPGQIIVSAIEHPSIALLAERMQQEGWQIDLLPVDSRGVAQIDALDELLTPETRLVSLMLGNNETGVLQPVEHVVAKCQPLGVPVHSDAVQCVGKIPVDFGALGLTAMTLTAHKFHGPTGIGALIVRSNWAIDPLLVGGFQQASLRPGTESAPLAIGMEIALGEFALKGEQRSAEMRRLRDRFERLLLEQVPEANIVAGDVPRLPHTSNVAFVGFDRQALMMALDLAGVACSTGSACASGSSEPSPVLLAMGCDEATVAGSLRFSLGAFSTSNEVDLAAERICMCCNKLRREI